jgi:hypothetical protein
MNDRVKEWDQYFSIHRELPAAAIRDLFDEIERLRANVHLAFYEGFAAAQRHTDSDFAWDKSEAREALREVE